MVFRAAGLRAEAVMKEGKSFLRKEQMSEGGGRRCRGYGGSLKLEGS